MMVDQSIEAIEWTTFNGFMTDDGEVCYQEGRTDETVARVTVGGREVVSPTHDLNAAYRNFNRRYARHIEAIENAAITEAPESYEGAGDAGFHVQQGNGWSTFCDTREEAEALLAPETEEDAVYQIVESSAIGDCVLAEGFPSIEDAKNYLPQLCVRDMDDVRIEQQN